MTHVAKSYVGGRAAERQPVEADATLRRPDQMPLDVHVTDLSFEGCRIESGDSLAVDDQITIGFAGVGRCSGRIVWSAGRQYGCLFDTSIGQADLAAALKGPRDTVFALRKERPACGTAKLDQSTHTARWALAVRLLIIVGLAVGTWAPIIAAVAWLRA